MEVYKLERTGDNPSYMPIALIENYISMIWTERYLPTGEFIMNTKNVSETLKLLPEGALISHRDTKAVMIVETRLVKLDTRGFPYLEVKGSAVEGFPENRHLEGKYQKKRTFRKDYSVQEAVGVLLWNALANGSGKDVTRPGDWSSNVKDKVPNLSIANSVDHVSGTRRSHRLTEGPLMPQIMALLEKGDLGIRSLRPPSSSKIMSVVWTIGERGNINGPTQTPNVPDLVLEVYKGVDRSQSSSVPDTDKIILRWDQGHLDNPEYLWSIKGHKTAMEIMSSVGGADQYATGTLGNTGFNRRVGSYDAGQPEYPDEPQNKTDENMAAWRAEKDAVDVQFLNDAEDEAQRELRRARRTSIFTGLVTENIPYKYKKHYNLGDRITLIGEYGETQDMIVAEYVRTDDDQGDRGFPGLVVP